MRLCDYGPTVVGLQELLYYNDHTSIDLLMHVHGLIKIFWAADDGGGTFTHVPPLWLRAWCLSVCLCVSITLSVNSPTGQTPQWIFTVDSLKDPDLRKDVPFKGLDDE